MTVNTSQEPNPHAKAAARGVVDVLDDDNPVRSDYAQVDDDAAASEDGTVRAFFYGLSLCNHPKQPAYLALKQLF